MADPGWKTVPLPRGELRWCRPARGIFRTEAHGYLCVKAVDVLLAAYFEAAADRGKDRMLVFHDFRDVSGYDSEARVQWTERSKPEIPNIERITFLTANRFVNMGVAVASMVLRNLESTPDLAAFEASVARAVSSRK